MMSAPDSQRFLGKYREIIVAVAFFLIFDLAVLVLNFYISYKISESAVEINLAGRQRMLSQRMTKELLIGLQDAQQLQDVNASIEKIYTSALGFNQTLQAFRQGGTVVSADNQPATLKAVAIPAAQDVLARADRLWQPLFQRIITIKRTNDDIRALFNAHLIGVEEAQDKSAERELTLEAAVRYAQVYNLDLLDLMNQFTNQLESAANQRANTLRQVQTAGILLALLNFGFILFKFIRRLLENDRRVEKARQETSEILGTVREGLFLLGQDFSIGSQYSASLSAILGKPIKAGDDLRTLLADMVSPESLKAATEYIGLLLGDRVKESLVQDLNPLVNLPVQLADAQGQGRQRYLSLYFNRVLEHGKIVHLLVTVFDVTTQVRLEQELAAAKQKAKAEMEVLLDLLKVNPAHLKHYLGRAERELLGINDQLRNIENSRDYRQAINQIFRQTHTLKGEAAALGLGIFEDLAQRFEDMLSELRGKSTVLGRDLLALPLPLDDFLNRIGQVRELSRRLSDLQAAFSEPNEPELVRNMTALAQRIAEDHAKQVELETDLALMAVLPPRIRHGLNDIALQLLRNAIVHGIESRSERLIWNKAVTGTVQVFLKQREDEYEFVMRDDGRGLIAEDIRAELLRRGLYTEAQLREFDDNQIVMKIFEPGFSTADSVGRDAGHGVGLDVVKHMIGELGARLSIATEKYSYTQFSICFPIPAEEATA
ncbi:ATP-binding protein [Methylomagnum ishizawai]|uniref:ATP-binding protein n=1 Tax=Methylomagnum ishizawai TaxID=1760988 RepID=UPI001C80DB1D|nr:ATP-binding protein [Methylomagnum ishizawai]